MRKTVSLLLMLALLTVAVSAFAQATPTPDCPPPPSGGQPPAGGPPPGGIPEGCLPPGGMAFGMAGESYPPTHADLAYAELSEAQKLDLFIPEGEGPFPLVVFVHGGAFRAGDKAMQANDVEPLLAAGYAVASINYRLSGEAIFPAQIEDAKAAVRWLRANAETYALDPERFASWGASAGGNIAALLGTTGDVAEFDNAELGNIEFSSRVQATVDWFGPIDFGLMDAQFAADETCDAGAESHNAADSPESVLVGGEVQSMLDVVAAANPVTYVSEDTPMFFIQHGSLDCTVPPAQSQLLYDAIVDLLGEDHASLTYFPEAGHGGNEFSDAANMAEVVAFLDKALNVTR
ncbi:MAG: alpha/beta hydrolase fold domain-containing protein [Phototrophicaceae bacterium]